jgi:hypothetical protein
MLKMQAKGIEEDQQKAISVTNMGKLNNLSLLEITVYTWEAKQVE